MNAEEWLIREDEVSRQGRIERLQWLLEHTPENRNWLFHDAPISFELFEQTWYCFVYGQYLATIILGISYIEHTLAALFFAYGRNDLERANFSALIDEAFKEAWIDINEKDSLDWARGVRNDVTHFRKPGQTNPLTNQVLMSRETSETIFENNARQIMLIVFHILNRTAVR